MSIEVPLTIIAILQDVNLGSVWVQSYRCVSSSETDKEIFCSLYNDVIHNWDKYTAPPYFCTDSCILILRITTIVIFIVVIGVIVPFEGKVSSSCIIVRWVCYNMCKCVYVYVCVCVYKCNMPSL